jgi:hypothetical protein
MSVRWRLNANGVQWFWNGHWYTCDPQMRARLTTQIYGITEGYSDADAPANEVDLKRLIA